MTSMHEPSLTTISTVIFLHHRTAVSQGKLMCDMSTQSHERGQDGGGKLIEILHDMISLHNILYSHY